eukprot:10873683-Alexandrium_andersonii.AAC.1
MMRAWHRAARGRAKSTSTVGAERCSYVQMTLIHTEMRCRGAGMAAPGRALALDASRRWF